MKSMRHLRRGIFAVAAALALSATATACSSGGDEVAGSGSGQIRLAANNTVASLPVVVADKQGFFQEEGLNVKITTVADISKIPPTLGKQYDIGFGVQPSLILAASKGIDIAAVSGNATSSVDNQGYVIMARPGAKIQSPADFAGKKLGSVTLNGNIHTATKYWLKQNGVDPASITEMQVPTPAMVDQLKAGLIDAAEMQQPFIELAKKAGMVEAGYALSAVGDPTYMSCWIADRSWATKNADNLTKYRAALDKANEWIEDNDKDARQVLADFTGQSLEVIGDAPLTPFSTELTVESIKQWDAPMKAVTDFKADLDYNNLVVAGK